MPLGYIPRSLFNTVILSFCLDTDEAPGEVRVSLVEEIKGWLAGFTEEYRLYGLEQGDPGYSDELVFPIELNVSHIGAGKPGWSFHDQTEVHSITVETNPEGKNERFTRYVCTLNKHEAA